MKSAKPRRRTIKSPMARRFDDVSRTAAEAVLLDLGTDLSLKLLSFSIKRDDVAIIGSTVDPSTYPDAESFRKDYLAVSLLSKSPSLELGIDRQAVALEKFKAAEQQCSATNKRLKKSYVNGLYSSLTPESILHSARGKIRHLLGSFSWDLAEELFSFGPGATYSRPRREGDPYHKFRHKPETTSGCAVLAYTSVRRIPSWYSHLASLTGMSMEQLESLPLDQRIKKLFNIVPGNRVHFVPKNAKTDRTIAIEPSLNGFIQHGIGRLIRRRLKRARLGDSSDQRIDLNDQTLNQRLAKVGSADGSLATLDLSAASDSVSTSLCELLLPEDWWAALRLCRSPVGVLPSGEHVSYEKVSSMGNGFTFELESLLFWAICRSCVDLLRLRDRRVAVYGDDIIVPTAAVATVRWMLSYCGFTVNKEKSFWHGPFRESCGKHYFRGCDVTPFYIRKLMCSPDRLIWFCNRVVDWSRLSYGLDPELKPSYDLVRSWLPRSLQSAFVPCSFGDIGLWGDFDEVAPQRSKYHLEAWTLKRWVPVQRSFEPGDVPFLLRQLSGAPCFLAEPRPWNQDTVLSDPTRPSVGSPKWRLRKLVVKGAWPCVGPWLQV